MCAEKNTNKNRGEKKKKNAKAEILHCCLFSFFSSVNYRPLMGEEVGKGNQVDDAQKKQRGERKVFWFYFHYDTHMVVRWSLQFPSLFAPLFPSFPPPSSISDNNQWEQRKEGYMDPRTNNDTLFFLVKKLKAIFCVFGCFGRLTDPQNKNLHFRVAGTLTTMTKVTMVTTRRKRGGGLRK